MNPYIITDITWRGTNNTQRYTHQAKIYIEDIIGCNVYFDKYYKKYEDDQNNTKIELKDSVGTVKSIFWKNDRWIIEITIVKVKKNWLFGKITKKTVYILPDNITRLSSDCGEYQNQVTYRRYPTYGMDLTTSSNKWEYLWIKDNYGYRHKNSDHKQTLNRIPENPPPCDDFIQSTITQHAPICGKCGNFQEKHMTWPPQRMGGNRSRRLVNNRKIKSSRTRTLRKR